MSTRGMSFLFAILTIINLPVYAYYYKGANPTAGNQAKGFEDYFTLLSLGNVGSSSYSCGRTNLAQIERGEDYSNIRLSCGLGSTLGSILHVGLIKDNEASCSKLIDNHKDFVFTYDNEFNSNEMQVQISEKEYKT